MQAILEPLKSLKIFSLTISNTKIDYKVGDTIDLEKITFDIGFINENGISSYIYDANINSYPQFINIIFNPNILNYGKNNITYIYSDGTNYLTGSFQINVSQYKNIPFSWREASWEDLHNICNNPDITKEEFDNFVQIGAIKYLPLNYGYSTLYANGSNISFGGANITHFYVPKQLDKTTTYAEIPNPSGCNMKVIDRQWSSSGSTISFISETGLYICDLGENNTKLIDSHCVEFAKALPFNYKKFLVWQGYATDGETEIYVYPPIIDNNEDSIFNKYFANTTADEIKGIVLNYYPNIGNTLKIWAISSSSDLSEYVYYYYQQKDDGYWQPILSEHTGGGLFVPYFTLT